MDLSDRFKLTIPVDLDVKQHSNKQTNKTQIIAFFSRRPSVLAIFFPHLYLMLKLQPMREAIHLCPIASSLAVLVRT